MKLILERWNRFLREGLEPYTNTATAYHSFGIGQSFGHEFSEGELEKVVRSISSEGFKPGLGQNYGKGVYTVLEPEDLNKRYGNFCLIFKVDNLDGFLVLDYKEAKKIKSNQSAGHTLKEQMERLGVLVTDELDAICKEVDSKNRSKYSTTSKYALALSKMPQVKQKIRGLIFEGITDGRVLVGYYPEDFSVTGYGEVHVSESTPYKDFIDSKDFFDKMYNFYKPKDARVDPKKFFHAMSYFLLFASRGATGSATQIIKDIDSQPALNRLIRTVISDEAYDDLYKKIYGPSFYEKYKAYVDSDVFDDEAEEEFEKALAQIPDFEEKEEKLRKLAYDIGLEEVERFFSRGYYDGMIRKFKLSDDLYVKNIKKV